VARPFAFERFLVEELEAVDRHVARRFFVGGEVQAILPQFVVGDLIGRLVEMLGQLAHGAHVVSLPALDHASTLQVFDHAATQFSGGTEFVWDRDGRHGMPPLGFMKYSVVYSH
jgi:hypothetical protein